MLSRWAQIKWWAGLPKDVRELTSAVVVILALAGVVVFLFKLNNGGDQQQIKQLRIQVAQKDSIIGQQSHDHDSIVAAMNLACQVRIQVLTDGAIAEYKATIAEYKAHQRDVLRAYDQTDRETKRVTNTQNRTNSTLRKAINEVKTNTDETQ